MVGHGRPWMAAYELVESSLVEQRGKAVGWGWSSRVWRCLPREELNQGGLVGEIKRSTKSLFLGKNRARSRSEGSQWKVAGGVERLSELVAELGTGSPFYRRGDGDSCKWVSREDGGVAARRSHEQRRACS